MLSHTLSSEVGMACVVGYTDTLPRGGGRGGSWLRLRLLVVFACSITVSEAARGLKGVKTSQPITRCSYFFVDRVVRA